MILTNRFNNVFFFFPNRQWRRTEGREKKKGDKEVNEIADNQVDSGWNCG